MRDCIHSACFQSANSARHLQQHAISAEKQTPLMIQFLHGKSDSVLQLGSGDMELQIKSKFGVASDYQ